MKCPHCGKPITVSLEKEDKKVMTKIQNAERQRRYRARQKLANKLGL